MNMLKVVVTEEGTGFRAVITGYRVVSKTGKVRKVNRDGYSL